MTVIIVKCAVTHSCGTDVALPALAAVETAGVSGCVTERSVHGTVTESDRLWSVTVVTFLIVSPLSRSPETVAVTETVSPPWTRTASWQHVMRHRRQIRL